MSDNDLFVLSILILMYFSLLGAWEMLERAFEKARRNLWWLVAAVILLSFYITALIVAVDYVSKAQL